MTPQRAAKHVQRALRSIPVDAVAPRVTAEEAGGLWCIVAGGLEFVPADGGTCETCWDDPLEYSQFARYVQARPERVHPSREAALAFVRSRLRVAAQTPNQALQQTGGARRLSQTCSSPSPAGC